MRKLDLKYQVTGEIQKIDGTPIPEGEPLVLFRARDVLLPQLLQHYRELCVEAGSPTSQVEMIDERIAAVTGWQAGHKDETHIPD